MDKEEKEEFVQTLHEIRKLSDADLCKLIRHGSSRGVVGAYTVLKERQPKRRGRPKNVSIEMAELGQKSDPHERKKSRRTLWNYEWKAKAICAHPKETEGLPDTILYELGTLCPGFESSWFTKYLVKKVQKKLKAGMTRAYVLWWLRDTVRRSLALARQERLDAARTSGGSP